MDISKATVDNGESEEIFLDQSSIEAALKNDIRYLRFKEPLERIFQNRYFRLFLGPAKLSVLLALVIYAVYGILDSLMFADVKSLFWKIRYGIVCPVLLLILLALHFIRTERMLQLCLLMAMIVGGVGVVLFNRIISSDYYMALVLVILYGCVVMPLRFRYAVSGSLFITVLYIIVIGIRNYNDPVPTNNLFDITSVNVFGFFASYLLEKHRRREFLQVSLLNIEKERMKELSIIDALTNVMNRRGFDESFRRLWQLCLRTGYPVAVLLVDVDFFKLYNDSEGHKAGDECLCRIANVLKTYRRREDDIVARYGGEEFILILAGASKDYAVEVANSICRQIRELRIPHPASDVDRYVTVSIGVTVCVPRLNDAREDIVAKADRALYTAKRQGRNRVVVSDTEG